MWDDAWADDDRWQRAVDDLKREGLIRGVRHQPQPLGAGERAEGAPHRAHRQRAGRLQHLRSESGGRAVPRVPRAGRRGHRARAVRRRQPDRHDDARHDAGPPATGATLYFTPENLAETLDRVEALTGDVPPGMTMPELALRFILANPDVTTVIPGMRRARHVEANLAASDGRRAHRRSRYRTRLRRHRWVPDLCRFRRTRSGPVRPRDGRPVVYLLVCACFSRSSL